MHTCVLSMHTSQSLAGCASSQACSAPTSNVDATEKADRERGMVIPCRSCSSNTTVLAGPLSLRATTPSVVTSGVRQYVTNRAQAAELLSASTLVSVGVRGTC